MPRHWLRASVAVVAVVAILAWLTPTVRARATAAVTVAEVLGASVWRPFAPDVSVREQSLAGGQADVYVGAENGPVVVLVPGAVPAGRDDERVRHLARTIARADRRVVVPELAVYEVELLAEDVERLVQVVLAVSAGEDPVALLGFSFGGSLALVAAADERLDGLVTGVATFGAYADLVGVVQAATTGASLVGDRLVPWPADPRAERVVREQLTKMLPPAEARSVRAALESDGAGPPSTPRARAVFRLLENERPARTYALARDLPEAIRSRIAAVSPTAVADRLADVRIVAMHARDDPVIPYGELLRLGAAIPNASLLTVEGLEHSELEVTAPRGLLSALDDLRTMWAFTSRVLRWQEPTWPWNAG